MKTISDVPDDLIGEIFSRVPLTSLTALRSTCKRWNDLSKTQVIGTKLAYNQQFLEFMDIDYKVCSLRFSFQGIPNKDDNFVDPLVNKIRKLKDVLISQVFQCDGLLLCVTKDNSRLLVWNPYLGQTRWIQTTRANARMTYDNYALGYEDNKNNRNHKISRFVSDRWEEKYIEVYEFRSNSWRVLDVNPDWEEPIFCTGVSFKGNTYFSDASATHLRCFDFTAERFGPRLQVPLKAIHYRALSNIRNEKLALMYYHYKSSEIIRFWISTKITPNEISWSMIFKVDRNHMPHDFPIYSFDNRYFINEEKKVAVLFRTSPYEIAWIVGEDKFIKYVNTREARKNHWDYSNLLSSSYVPSLVQLKLNQP